MARGEPHLGPDLPRSAMEELLDDCVCPDLYAGHHRTAGLAPVGWDKRPEHDFLRRVSELRPGGFNEEPSQLERTEVYLHVASEQVHGQSVHSRQQVDRQENPLQSQFVIFVCVVIIMTFMLFVSCFRMLLYFFLVCIHLKTDVLCSNQEKRRACETLARLSHLYKKYKKKRKSKHPISTTSRISFFQNY